MSPTMSASAEQAQSLVHFLISDFENETATTKRVLSAVPAGHENYTPHEKNMSALKLAWHIASADAWFLNGIASGEFAGGEGEMPASIRSAADVVKWYDDNIPQSIARVRAMTPEQCTRILDLMGMMKLPATVMLQLALKHSVHHRGQLSTYLRPMGAKVPGIYGPSGDTQ